MVMLGLVVCLGLAAVFLFHLPQRLFGWHRQEATLFEARTINAACQDFLSVRGKYPAALEDLVPDFLPDRRSLADPEHPEFGEIGYYYYGTDGPQPGPSVLMASKAVVRGKRVIVHFAGDAGIAPFTHPRIVP
jgi:hypothetical protein